MDIPLLGGRGFTPQDRAGSQAVVIISQGTAAKYWPKGDAIGKRLNIDGTPGMATIIGIVGNVDIAPFGSSDLHVYVPYMQVPSSLLEDKQTSNQSRSLRLAVRASTDPQTITSALVAQVHSLDSQLAIAEIRTMTQVIRSSVAGPKFDAFLLGLFASLALFLAAIGVYGVLAHATAQRTHEIGIRVALGAQRWDIMSLVLREGTKLALIGVAIGIAGSFALTRLISTLLFGVSATDPLMFTAVAILLVLVALLACYIPARRAMKVDPMVALRYE